MTQTKNNPLGKLLGNKLVGNALSLYVVQGLNYLLPLLLFPYLLRVLGPNIYGAIIFAQSIMGYLVIVTDFGFNLTSARDISVERDNLQAVAKIFWITMAAKCVLLVISAVVVAVVICMIPELRKEWQLITICSVIVIGNIVFPQWYFQGLERLGDAALIQAVSKFLYAACVVAFINSPDDVWTAAAIMSAQQIFAVIAALALRKPIIPPSYYRPTLADVRQALSSGWPLFVGNASTSLYGNTNTFVLGLMSGTVAVAHYNLAIRLISAVQGLAMPITQVVFPRASLVFSQDQARGWALIRRVAIFLFPPMIAISIVMAVFAPEIVTLVGGESYIEAASVLRIMLPVPVLVALGTLLAHCVMVNIGLSKDLVRVYVIVGISNLIVMPLLILNYSAEGAAMSLTLAEALIEVMLIWILWSRRNQTTKNAA